MNVKSLFCEAGSQLVDRRHQKFAAHNRHTHLFHAVLIEEQQSIEFFNLIRIEDLTNRIAQLDTFVEYRIQPAITE